MSAQHTPGPWIADNVNVAGDSATAVWQDDGTGTYYHRTSQVCECFFDDSEDLMDQRTNRHVTVVEAEANARLIAAAPDMLAACREFEQLITRDSNDLGFHLQVVPICVEAVARIRAAIAKAEGRS